MTADEYLRKLLRREQVDTGLYAPARSALTTLEPLMREWAGQYFVSMDASGSFAKGTGNSSGTDVDAFVSLTSTTPNPLKEIYTRLAAFLEERGYPARRQNVSIGTSINGTQVDVVPGVRQDQWGNDHSLYRRKADSWTKTNVAKHISHVKGSNRIDEIRILKLWRSQKRLDISSFCLELFTINALHGARVGALSDNVRTAFTFFNSPSFANAKAIDPSNSNNIVSDDLTVADRNAISVAAGNALIAPYWEHIVQ